MKIKTIETPKIIATILRILGTNSGHTPHLNAPDLLYPFSHSVQRIP